MIFNAKILKDVQWVRIKMMQYQRQHVKHVLLGTVVRKVPRNAKHATKESTGKMECVTPVVVINTGPWSKRRLVKTVLEGGINQQKARNRVWI